MELGGWRVWVWVTVHSAPRDFLAPEYRGLSSLEYYYRYKKEPPEQYRQSFRLITILHKLFL